MSDICKNHRRFFIESFLNFVGINKNKNVFRDNNMADFQNLVNSYMRTHLVSIFILRPIGSQIKIMRSIYSWSVNLAVMLGYYHTLIIIFNEFHVIIWV